MKIDSIKLKELLQSAIAHDDDNNPLKIGVLFAIKVIEILEKVGRGKQ